MTLLDSARAYLSEGFALIPVHRVGPDRKTCSCSRGAGCKSAGKHPKLTDWQQGPAMSAADIEATWDMERAPNIGIRTGSISGIVVLDLDGDEGLDWWRDAIAEHGEDWYKTRTVQTGSGGFHLYFRCPDFTISNSQSRIAPGVDIRGEGGQVVAPPSISAKGEYLLRDDEVTQIAPLPDWLAELAKPREVEMSSKIDRAAVEATPLDARGLAYMTRARELELARLDELAAAAVGAGQVYRGAPWNGTCFEVACNLIEIANTLGEPLEPLWEVFTTRAPSDPGFDQEDHAKIFKSAMAKVGTTARSVPPAPADSGSSIDPMSSAYSAGGVGGGADTITAELATDGREKLDVGNAAVMADWLQANMGRGKLSGMYLRGNEIVHVPRIDEEGYKPLSEDGKDNDGPAQIRVMTDRAIASRVHYTYRTYKLVKNADGEKFERPELFPMAAAATAAAAPDLMYNLNPLLGVVHSVTVRPDGSLITKPGYDHSTGLLYLPDPGLTVPPVPEVPTTQDVEKARAGIEYMLQDFSFVTPVDRANYIGMMLTPLLRNVAPAPYKLALIEAHQPASGKTFLARALMNIHGGVFRSEMPHDEPELNKVITSVLDVTTGPVVVFDNATGVIRSSTLAGLLTSGTWQERRLGATQMVSAKNDRLWTITGNNVAISGDLARRTLRVLIDPGVPNPEKRTGFAISDFESWVRENRGWMLWALTVLIRHWFVQGCPTGGERGADSYRRWGETVEGILRTAGFSESAVGRFDDPAHGIDAPGAEDAEWQQLLEIIHEIKGQDHWTARDILDLVDEGYVRHDGIEGVTSPARPIPYDALPHELVTKRKSNDPISRLSKSFGWWLTNRAGRWAGDYSVRKVQQSKHGIVWKVVKYGE